MLPEAIRYKIKWFCKLTDISLAQIQGEDHTSGVWGFTEVCILCYYILFPPLSLSPPSLPSLSSHSLCSHAPSPSFPLLLLPTFIVSFLAAPCAEKRKLNTLEKIVENLRKDEACLQQVLEQAGGLHRPHQV